MQYSLYHHYIIKNNRPCFLFDHVRIVVGSQGQSPGISHTQSHTEAPPTARS